MLRSARIGLIADFDGTIAPIAPTPDEAELSRRAADSLARLAGKLDLVCVLSGRSVRDLQGKIAVDGVVYVGNHGAEHLAAGRLSVAPEVARHRDAIRGVFDYLRSVVAIPGLVWDDKR